MKRFFLLIGGVLWACKPVPPPGMTDPGQLIYLGYKDTFASCSRCHGREGEGAGEGPEIHDAIEKFGRDEVRETILNGVQEGRDKMPSFREEFTPEEIEQILDFITHWGAKDSTENMTPAADSTAARGAFLFN